MLQILYLDSIRCHDKQIPFAVLDIRGIVITKVTTFVCRTSSDCHR